MISVMIWVLLTTHVFFVKSDTVEPTSHKMRNLTKSDDISNRELVNLSDHNSKIKNTQTRGSIGHKCSTIHTFDKVKIELELISLLTLMNISNVFNNEMRGPMIRDFGLQNSFEKRDSFSASVPVYWHVINQGPGVSNGDITDQMIASQINALNYGVAGSGFTFYLVSTDRTTNSVWFQMSEGSTEESSAKQQLRQGNASALNIYSVNPNSQSVGWGSFPWSYASAPFNDGIVIMYSTVPGGSAYPYNQGHTALHELGHWLGLYHTFMGGCCNAGSCGDFVSDTAAEASPAYGCPSNRDSCSLPGVDPVGNYMDYTDDTCTNYFTYGQANKMISSWRVYRQNF